MNMVLRVLFSLLLAAPCFASPERYAVDRFVKPIHLTKALDMARSVTHSQNGQLDVMQVVGSYMEIKHHMTVEGRPMKLQWHPEYQLFTLTGQETHIISPIKEGRLNPLLRKLVETVSTCSIQEIIRVFDYPYERGKGNNH